jgi:hypothetical protein
LFALLEDAVISAVDAGGKPKHLLLPLHLQQSMERTSTREMPRRWQVFLEVTVYLRLAFRPMILGVMIRVIYFICE